MDFEETMVEEFDDAAADDALPEDIAEETDESEESLDSLNDGEEEETPAEEPQQPTEPGWIKQRVNKAVQRAVAETEARMQAMFDQQMAPIRDKMLTDEAKELVRQGEFKSLDRAKEYLQLKQGMNPVAQTSDNKTQERPRNEQGQYAPKEDPATMAKIDMLKHQADRIQAAGGPDVIGEFQRNEEIKQKIVNGEMDFYDLAEQMKAPKRRPPSPMRSPNGASVKANAIESMSDEQFKRLEKRISEGARYSLK